MVPLLHLPHPQITIVIHCFRRMFVSILWLSGSRVKILIGKDSSVNEEILERIDASHDNLIDVEDPRMHEGKLKNNILFGRFKFEISETIPCRTNPESRSLHQKNYNKYLKRFVGQMLIDDICGSGLESMEDKFHDMNLAVISSTWHQKNRQQKKKMDKLDYVKI